MTLDPTQTAALISPNGKEGEFFTGNGHEEMSQRSFTNVDLTDGASSNSVKGSPNKSEGLNGSTSGTKDGPVDLTVSDTKSSSNGSSK